MTIALILSFGILAGFYSNNQDEMINRNDLEDLKVVAENSDVTITSWMALSRSKLGQAKDNDDMKLHVEKIMNEYDTYSWKSILEEENSHYVWQGTRENKLGIAESIKLKAYTSGAKYEIAITHEAKGNELTNDQLEWVSQSFVDADTFYTVSGVSQFNSNQLEEVATSIIAATNGEVVEKLSEKRFVSVSAYSQAFESELLTANQEKINLQVGLRADVEKNKIDITIGTPIITTEY